MRRSDAREFHQAYNAQTMVRANGGQLALATKLVATTAAASSVAAVILGMQRTIGPPMTVLADAGYTSAAAVAALRADGIESLVTIGRTQPRRRYDFRPPPTSGIARRIIEPWRIAMKAKLENDDGRNQYRMRKQTVKPVFGIIKSTIGFTRFRLRSLANATTEWSLVTLAYNRRRIAKMQAA